MSSAERHPRTVPFLHVPTETDLDMSGMRVVSESHAPSVVSDHVSQAMLDTNWSPALSDISELVDATGGGAAGVHSFYDDGNAEAIAHLVQGASSGDTSSGQRKIPVDPSMGGGSMKDDEN